MFNLHRNHIHCLFMLGLSFVTFSACDGLLDTYDVLPTIESNGYDQLSIDATTYDDWTYISLHDLAQPYVKKKIPTDLVGEWDGITCYTRQEIKFGTTTELSSVPTDTQPEPEDWDIAIHHFDIRTNGGMAFETDYTSLDQVPTVYDDIPNVVWEADQLTTDRVWVDLSSSLSFNIGCQTIAISLPLSRMASMDVSNPPPIYQVSGKVCLLRMRDDAVVALFLDNYMDARGHKGHLTISILPLQ